MCNIGLSSKKNVTFLEDLGLVPPTEFPPFIGDRLCCGPVGFSRSGETVFPHRAPLELKGFPGMTVLKLEKGAQGGEA